MEAAGGSEGQKSARDRVRVSTASSRRRSGWRRRRGGFPPSRLPMAEKSRRAGRAELDQPSPSAPHARDRGDDAEKARTHLRLGASVRAPDRRAGEKGVGTRSDGPRVLVGFWRNGDAPDFHTRVFEGVFPLRRADRHQTEHRRLFSRLSVSIHARRVADDRGGVPATLPDRGARLAIDEADRGANVAARRRRRG